MNICICILTVAIGLDHHMLHRSLESGGHKAKLLEGILLVLLHARDGIVAHLVPELEKKNNNY